jgi:hypothetical protein
MAPAQVTKLSGIEAGATADQTGTEIVTAINTELGGTTWQSGGGGSSGYNWTMNQSQTGVTEKLIGMASLAAGTYTPKAILDCTGVAGTQTACSHFNGTNGSTTIIDDVSGHTINCFGTASISTTQSKFGGSSLVITASGANNGNYVRWAAHSDLDVGSGDFTFRCWVRLSAVNQAAAIMAQRTSGAASGIFCSLSSGSVFFYIGNGSSWFAQVSFAEPAINTWALLEFVRSGSNLYGFKDGVLAASVGSVSGTVTTGLPFTFGRDDGNSGSGYSPYSGYIDDFELHKTALHTSGYSVPTAEYSTSGQSIISIRKASDNSGLDTITGTSTLGLQSGIGFTLSSTTIVKATLVSNAAGVTANCYNLAIA